MNEMNSLEAQLHSWQPRRPSAGLERRLFPSPVRLMPKMAWFVGWLVPATACALLTFSVFTSGSIISAPPSGQTALSGNGSSLAPAPDGFRQGENNLLSVTFNLTNRNGAASSFSTFTGNRAN